MKTLFSFITIILFTLNVHAQTGDFGAALSDQKSIKAEQLEATLGDQKVAEMKVEGEIVEVCKMKGCWMTVATGDGQEVRVSFKDYEFFVPKDAAGYNVVFEGEAKKEVVDVATLKHYAEDAGKSAEEIAAITKDEVKLTFVASGVKIVEK